MNYNREYKSSVFSMLYEDRENVMDLYNGIYDDKCTDPNDITINTLSDEDGVSSGIFARFKNDLSFIFGAYQNLFEHQSTINRNIPLRMLIYVTKLITSSIDKRKLYREKAIKIETPRFVVFYNGRKDYPAKAELKLSDQYKTKQTDPDLELKVTVYNINADKGIELLERTRTLKEYMTFVDRVGKAMEGAKDKNEKTEAMNAVVDGCIKDGILAKLLMERREEVIMASIFEYDQAAHEWALHEDGYDEGVEAGIQQGIRQGEKRGEKRGERKTKLLVVKNLMETMTLTVEQALDALKITEQKERQSIIKAVQRGC